MGLPPLATCEDGRCPATVAPRPGRSSQDERAGVEGGLRSSSRRRHPRRRLAKEKPWQEAEAGRNETAGKTK